MLWVALVYNLWYYWETNNSYTVWRVPFGHWRIGGSSSSRSPRR